MLTTYYCLQDAFCYCSLCPICHQSVDEWYFSNDSMVREIKISQVLAGYNPYKGYPINYTLFDGIFITGRKVACRCNCYEYSLQLHIDLKEHHLSKIILNSETVTIEDGEDVHEIRNIYTMDKTEYTRISKNKSFDTLKIPLVSENLFNPQETLIRLKKLLIFS